VDLSVAPLTGWTRETPYAATGLPWVSPSPNIPSPRTALVYPGMCFLEGTNISEGRGTTRPFELFGAPWLDARAFAGALNDSGLPGARFIPTHFRPQFDKHAGTTCAGALLEVTDPGQFRAVETGMRVIEAARRLVPNRFAWRTEPYEFDPRPAIDLLTGSPRFRQAVDAGSSLDAELARHRGGAREFESRRVPHLLYADRRPAVLLFCGGHGSGKTTLLTRLLPRLLATGLRVGAVKHTSKDAPDDIEGKDSARLAESGACAVAFVTPRRATGRRFGTEESLETILSREFSDCDLVLVEGYKDRDGFPKIEVTRSGAARPRVSGAQLRIHDGFASPDEVPSLHFDELERIVEAILRIAGLQRGA
jgi:molybdopterin-guanine dinucleotide biosynthesis protein MobB